MKSYHVTFALAAVACYRAYRQFFPNEPCDQDPPIQLEPTLGESTQDYSWNSCDVFSLEYDEARSKFRKAAKQAGAQGSSIPIVMNDGTDESPLTTDIALLKGDLPGTLVITSGTHGVEGYAGSAVQLALLQEGMLPAPDKRPTVVLIHAVNPSGMKNYRRSNENNVDLNRNGILHFESFLQNRDPNIAGYDDFRPFIAPQRKPSQWWDGTLGYWLHAIPLLYKNGYVATKRAIVAGQYHHPEGIMYGGKQLEPSIQGIKDFVKKEEHKILPAAGSSDTVVWIDVHTGLGPFGLDTARTEKPVSMKKMKEWFPDAYHVLSPESGSLDGSAMSGYELSLGTLTDFIFQLSHEKVFPITQEFGTLPGVLVARAFVLENMMYHYGDENGRKTLGRSWLQAAFYPQSKKWRSMVVQRGVALALQSIEYIKSRPDEERF